MKTRKQFSTKKVGSFATAKLLATMLCIIAALAIIGCKEDEPETPPPPPPPPNEVSVGNFKVTINNHELLSAEKLGILKKVIPEVLAGKTLTSNLTINVINGDSVNSFTPAGTKTLNVGATWANGATESQIKIALGGRVDTWIQ